MKSACKNCAKAHEHVCGFHLTFKNKLCTDEK